MANKADWDDTGLVSSEETEHPRRWLALFSLSAIVTAVPYVLYTWLSPTLYSAALTQDVMNQQAVAAYILNGGCTNVLVGSSMVYAVREELFPISVCNLGLPGDGAATGLAILERLEKPPKIVIVEINALRDENKELVGMLDLKPAWWRDLNLKMKMGPRFTDMFGRSGQRSATTNARRRLTPEELKALIASPPQEVARLRRELPNRLYDGPIGPEAEAFYKRFAQAAAALEARGTKVLFVNMPVAEDREDMILVMDRYSRGRTIRPTVDVRSLRWLDSTHLDERSAAIYAAGLAPYFRNPGH